MRPPRAPERVAAAAVGLLALLMACGPSLVTSGPSPAPGTSSPAATDPAPPTPLPTDPGATAPAPPPSQTDTEWGRIWDGLPTAFPRYPGAAPTETGEGPASAILDAGRADPTVVATFYQVALEGVGFSAISMSGRREDGSWEIEAVGDAGCGLRVTVTPLGGSTFVTILYGADCPFG